MKDKKGFFNIFQNKLLLGYVIGGFLVSFGSNLTYSNLFDEMFSLGVDIIIVAIFANFLVFLELGLLIWGPFLGRWIDKRYSPNGRRRIYLLVTSIAIGFIMLTFIILPFKFGILNPFLNLLLLFLIFGAYFVGIFIFSLNYSSLFPEMFQNLQERTDARTFLVIMAIIGNILGDLINISINFLPFISSALVFLGSYVLLQHGVEEPYNKFLINIRSEPDIQKEQSILKNPLFKSFLILSILLWVSYQFLLSGFSNTYLLLAMSSTGVVSPEFSNFLELFTNYAPQITALLFLIYWRKLSLTRGIKRGLKVVVLLTLILVVFGAISFDIYSGIIISSILEGVLRGIPFFLILFLAIIIDDYFINTMKRREASHFGIYNLVSGMMEFFGLIIFNFISLFAYRFGTFGTSTEFLMGYIPKVIAFIIGGILLLTGFLYLKKIPLNEEEYNKIETRVMEIRKEFYNEKKISN